MVSMLLPVLLDFADALTTVVSFDHQLAFAKQNNLLQMPTKHSRAQHTSHKAGLSLLNIFVVKCSSPLRIHHSRPTISCV